MIQWSSKVPKTIATSSTNAEVQAALGLCKDVVWLRTMLDELGYKQQGSTVMYQDNQPAIYQINDNKGTAMSKHYLILLRKIQELVHLGIIHMNPIDTSENVADLFTKPLEHRKFWYFTQQALGDYVDDTHAYLITDLANQKLRTKKPRNGGSAQTYRQQNEPRLNITDTIINTIKHLEGDNSRSYEHASVIGTSSRFDSIEHFDHDQYEKSHARQVEEVARRGMTEECSLHTTC